MLGRVGISVDAPRVHRQVQDIGRVATVEQHVPVGMPRGKRHVVLERRADAGAHRRTCLRSRCAACKPDDHCSQHQYRNHSSHDNLLK